MHCCSIVSVILDCEILRGALVSFGPDSPPWSYGFLGGRYRCLVRCLFAVCQLPSMVPNSSQSLLTCSSVSMISANVSCKWAFDVSHFSMSGLEIGMDFAVRQIASFSRSGEVFVVSVGETQLAVRTVLFSSLVLGQGLPEPQTVGSSLTTSQAPLPPACRGSFLACGPGRRPRFRRCARL